MRAASSAERMRALAPSCVGGPFEWREEDAGDPPLDVLPAEEPGALALRFRAAGAAPHQRMRLRQRRRHHPLAHRLENLRVAQVRNQQTEGQGGRPAGGLNEGAGPGAALDQPGHLEVAHRPARP